MKETYKFKLIIGLSRHKISCSSPVGYRSGRVNSVSLAGGCWFKGTVIHEIGHSIGKKGNILIFNCFFPLFHLLFPQRFCAIRRRLPKV